MRIHRNLPVVIGAFALSLVLGRFVPASADEPEVKTLPAKEKTTSEAEAVQAEIEEVSDDEEGEEETVAAVPTPNPEDANACIEIAEATVDATSSQKELQELDRKLTALEDKAKNNSLDEEGMMSLMELQQAKQELETGYRLLNILNNYSEPVQIQLDMKPTAEAKPECDGLTPVEVDSGLKKEVRVPTPCNLGPLAKFTLVESRGAAKRCPAAAGGK